jgi:inhibitor of cysteine peptidase
MKMKLRALMVFSFMLMSMSVYAKKTEMPAVQPNNPENNVYTVDKQHIMVSANQPEFILKLKSNPTTGYSWFLREYDSAIITPVKHEFLPPTQMLIGASGFELWTFKVKAAGFTVPQQTTIRMIYARPWQANDGATQSIFIVSTSGK